MTRNRINYFGESFVESSDYPWGVVANQVSDDTQQELEQAEQEYFGPKFLARLHARLHLNPVTGLITKVVVTMVGVLVMLAGLIMMVTPGPGIVGLLVGLAILSTEWRWADRWLDSARAAARRAADKAREMDPTVRRQRVALTASATLLALLVAVLLLDLFGWPGLAIDGWDWVQDIVTVLPDLPGM